MECARSERTATTCFPRTLAPRTPVEQDGKSAIKIVKALAMLPIILLCYSWLFAKTVSCLAAACSSASGQLLFSPSPLILNFLLALVLVLLLLLSPTPLSPPHSPQWAGRRGQVNLLMWVGGDTSDTPGTGDTYFHWSVEFFGLIALLLVACKHLK